MQTLKTLKQVVVIVTSIATLATAMASIGCFPMSGTVITGESEFYRGLFADLVKAVATLSVAFLGWLSVKVVGHGETLTALKEDIEFIKNNCSKCNHKGV